MRMLADQQPETRGKIFAGRHWIQSAITGFRVKACLRTRRRAKEETVSASVAPITISMEKSLNGTVRGRKRVWLQKLMSRPRNQRAESAALLREIAGSPVRQFLGQMSLETTALVTIGSEIDRLAWHGAVWANADAGPPCRAFPLSSSEPARRSPRARAAGRLTFRSR